MKLSRRLLAATLLTTVATVTPASADPGRVYKDATGFGVVVTPSINGGTGSIQICAHAQLFGTGPLATTVAVVTEGAEHYATTGYTSLNGAGHGETIFGSTAAACSPSYTLHGGQNSTYALEFEIVATGTLILGATSQSICTGTVLRALDGPVVKLNPCEVV